MLRARAEGGSYPCSLCSSAPTPNLWPGLHAGLGPHGPGSEDQLPPEEGLGPRVLGGGEDLGHGAFLHRLSPVQEEEAVAQAPGLEEVVGGEDHAPALLRGPAQKGLHPEGVRRVQVGGGFISQDKLRFTGQRPGYGYPLLLAP